MRIPVLLLLLAAPLAAQERAALELPPELWREALAHVDHAGKTLGYTSDQMRFFNPDPFVLRAVDNLFRDVAALPRFSGKLAEQLLADARNPAEIVRAGFALTDVAAARNLPLPEPGENVDGIPEGCSPALRRFLALVVNGAKEADPWLRAAYAQVDRAEYADVIAPWMEERLGQGATLKTAAFENLKRLDRAYLSFGSVILLAHLKRALEGLAPGEKLTGGPLTFDTPFGPVRIYGDGADRIEGKAFLTVDLGGDDTYDADAGVPCDRIGLVVDFGGNDLYDGGARPVAIGCGFFGVGAIFDLSGNDRYTCRESGIGCAWFGTGLVVDFAGKDSYYTERAWGQGAAHGGVGALIDLEGDDSYSCAEQSQGMGATYGTGLILDVAGNDSYLARDDGAPSALYNNLSVAMSQGCGYGRRADLGDGHSLGGGFGLLIDGAGDDTYHATCWSQGCGYWWGVGILEDLGGNDSYRNGKYSSGAAAHFAIGLQVDLKGDDRYNVGNTVAVNQFHGHARDGAIGVAIDGEGNDRYFFKSHCGGSADLASLALFWDRRGDDVYEADPTPTGEQKGWSDTLPFGTTTFYEPMRNIRDDMDAVGIFLDTGGKDAYPAGFPAKEGGQWSTIRGPRSWGFGFDGEAK